MTLIQAIVVFFMAAQTYALFKNYNQRVTDEFYTPLYYGIATLVGIFFPLYGILMLACLSGVLCFLLLIVGRFDFKIFLITLMYSFLCYLCA